MGSLHSLTEIKASSPLSSVTRKELTVIFSYKGAGCSYERDDLFFSCFLPSDLMHAIAHIETQIRFGCIESEDLIS